MATRTRVLCIGARFDRLVEALREAGYEVMVASTTQTAVAIFKLFPPAVIVSSAGTDGRILETSRKISGVPVVRTPADVPEGEWVGILDHVSSVLRVRAS